MNKAELLLYKQNRFHFDAKKKPKHAVIHRFFFFAFSFLTEQCLATQPDLAEKNKRINKQPRFRFMKFRTTASAPGSEHDAASHFSVPCSNQTRERERRKVNKSVQSLSHGNNSGGGVDGPVSKTQSPPRVRRLIRDETQRKDERK